MTSKKVQGFKKNCFGYFEVNLKSHACSFHRYAKLTSSWRRESPPSGVVYRTRGRNGITHGTKNYSFSLFCMNDFIV